MSTESNGTRRQFGSPVGGRIIKQHLVYRAPDSDLYDKHGMVHL